MEIVDQLQRTIKLPHKPKRIISLVPSQTELLVDLGLRQHIVGVTKFCVHPQNLRKEKQVVGGTKQIHIQKIKALNPDIIICNKEENTLSMVEEMESIAPVWISDVNSIDDSLDLIHRLGALFQVTRKAKEIVKTVNAQIVDFNKFISNFPKRKVAYLIWKNPFMAAGSNTFINSFLKLNRFENIIDRADSRYPEITLNDLKEAELILLSSEPYPFNNSHVMELQQFSAAEIKLVDGEYFSWYGSRMSGALEYFKTLH